MPASLRAGVAVIHAFWKTLPNAPGVYRMIDAEGTVLYVGKAHSLKKRVASYAQGIAPTAHIARMISETVAMEFVTPQTETEALLRGDKSFPYIPLTGDHPELR